MANISGLQKAVEDLAQREVTRRATDLQLRMKRLGGLHKGKPVDEVKGHLTADFRTHGQSITEPELTRWATAISEGVPITVTGHVKK